MSDEESTPRRLRVHVSDDDRSEIQVDDLDTEIPASLSIDSETNRSEEDFVDSEESEIYDHDDSNFDEYDELMDEISEPNSPTGSLEWGEIRSDEYIFNKVMDNWLEGKSIVEYLERFPSLCPLEIQKNTIEFSEEMLEDFIYEKVALLLKTKHQSTLNDFVVAREKNDFWKNKFETLKEELVLMKKELDELVILPPPPNQFRTVRNVGTQINLPPLIDL